MNIQVTELFEFCKVRDVETPTVGTIGSAGIDFYIPNDYQQLSIKPHSSMNIPSGIKVKLSPGTVLVAFNKSGVALTKQLLVGACVVDSDYRGEIHLHVVNTSPYQVFLEAGRKLVQFIYLPYFYPQLSELSFDEYEKHANTQRGTGGFGSTDRRQS